MGDRILKEYAYRARLKPLVWSATVFAGAAAVLLWKAITIEGAVRVFGMTLEPPAGRNFLFVLAGLSACFVLVAFVVAIDRAGGARRIAFTDEAIIVPIRRFSRGERVVKLNTISDVTIADTYGQRFITFKHPDGKFAVMASMLPDDAAFDEIVQQLARHAGKGTGWSGLTRNVR